MKIVKADWNLEQAFNMAALFGLIQWIQYRNKSIANDGFCWAMAIFSLATMLSISLGRAENRSGEAYWI